MNRQERRRFLFWTTPVDGHVAPGLPIARRLAAEGHEVRWYTGASYKAKIEATGAVFEPMAAAADPHDTPLDERLPGRVGLEGLDGFRFDLKHVFLDDAPAQIADVRRILETFPADVVVVDTAVLGAPLLGELDGVVWATFGISVLTVGGADVAPFGTGLPPATHALHRLRNRALHALTERVIFRDVVRHERGIRARLGAPARTGPLLEGTISPYLYLQAATPAFEYPRRDLPATVHWIGPLLPDAGSAPLPDWWGDLDGDRPVVLVTQGTVADDSADLILPTLEALAEEDVLVVAAGGGTLDPALVPANARTAPFVPFGALLPRVSAMVTNGGFGGVQFALAHGVPLVVAGTTEEKPEIAARVEWSGTGISLRTKRPEPAAVRDAVRRVLGETSFAANAARVAAGYAGHDAPAEAAALLTELAGTGRPVLRR